MESIIQSHLNKVLISSPELAELLDRIDRQRAYIQAEIEAKEKEIAQIMNALQQREAEREASKKQPLSTNKRHRSRSPAKYLTSKKLKLMVN